MDLHGDGESALLSDSGSGGAVIMSGASVPIIPIEGSVRVRLVPVEAIEYDPYGRPSIHARTSSGGAALMVWNEQAGPAVASGGGLASNPREGVAAGAYLRANDSPIGATSFFGRVENSAAQSSIGWAYLFTARPWSPAPGFGRPVHFERRVPRQ